MRKGNIIRGKEEEEVQKRVRKRGMDSEGSKGCNVKESRRKEGKASEEYIREAGDHQNRERGGVGSEDAGHGF